MPKKHLGELKGDLFLVDEGKVIVIAINYRIAVLLRLNLERASLAIADALPKAR